MYIDFIIDVIKQNADKDAIIINNVIYKYNIINEEYKIWGDFLKKNVDTGSVVAVQADYSIKSISLILALIENNNIFVPLSINNKDIEKKIKISEAQYFFRFGHESYDFHKYNNKNNNVLIKKMQTDEHPGIIIFSSGSTGEPKAALHDFTNLLNKFKVKRQPLKTINFLLFDHWGGLNTLFYILSNAGVVGIVEDRTPEKICEFISKYKIELLPTTPTFINLILMSRIYLKYDLSSLKIVSYGTEAMPESTLKTFHKLFPSIQLKQTYGLTELGVMRTKSKSSDSLWLKVGGEDYQTKVINDTLFVKARSSIVGYLNAPSPYDNDGWYNTGDKVEVDGEWIKILGRDSDIINVGGQKVYPIEVESILLEMDNVKEVSVFAKDNPIMGKVVGARINLVTPESINNLKKRVRQYCKERIESYKIPAHIEITDENQISERFKKVR